MSDEIRELRNEIIALKESVGKLEGKIAELIKENEKLKKENETLKAEKVKQNTTGSTIPIPNNSQPMKRSHEEGGSSNQSVTNFKRPRFIQNWLIDSLPWIPRKELANSSLSTSCETFRQLCWPKLHQKVKPRKITLLKFTKICDEQGNFRVQLNIDNKIVPIASIPPLEYILGIGIIDLEIVNDEVLNFFKSIPHLLQNCKLHLNFNSIYSKRMTFAYLPVLLEYLADKIFKFTFDGSDLNAIDIYFPAVIDQIQFISIQKSITKSSEINIIWNWLSRQSNNEKQKIIEFAYIYHQDLVALISRIKEVNNRKNLKIFHHQELVALISRIKEEFSHSNSPSNFLICYSTEWVHEEFVLENRQANEILTLYQKNELFYLVRYPKGQEHWMEDGEKKINELPNSTYINISA